MEAILLAAQDVQTTRFSEVASSAVIVFEHLITIDQEVEFILKAPWSVGKALFWASRYYTLSTVIVNNYALFTPFLSESFCLSWFYWQGATGLLVVIICQLCLQMRLYALWCLSKRVLVLMSVGFMTSITCSAYIMIRALVKLEAAFDVIPGIPICIPLNVSKTFWTFWIPVLVFETVLLGLALASTFQTSLRKGRLLCSGRHLVDILVRDSLLYFVVVFSTYLVNMCIWIASTTPMAIEIPIGWSVALSGVMVNRIILNVRALQQQLAAESRARQDMANNSSADKEVDADVRRLPVVVSFPQVGSDIELAVVEHGTRGSDTDGMVRRAF